MSDQTAIDTLHALLERNPALATDAAGWKVALNFRAVQQKLGLTHSLAAPLARLQTYASGARLEHASDQLVVEAELALKLAADARGASDPLVVEWAAPCLEVLDYALPRNDLATMFGHTFFHVGIMLGAPRPLEQVELLAPYPRSGSAQRLVGTVPDDVLDALDSLRARVIEAGGMLRKGQLVLCGSYIEPQPLVTALEVDYGPRLGALAISR